MVDHWGGLKGDAPWVCQWTSRKSVIRWLHCGNCINPRQYPKLWEKVALQFKRGVLLRDLPQLSSGNQTSLFTDHQRWASTHKRAARCWVWRWKKTTTGGINLVSYFIFETRIGVTRDDEFYPHLPAKWIVRCSCKRWVTGLLFFMQSEGCTEHLL